MRKSKHEAAETRKRIVETAASEFRKNGINGIGVADVMGEAGLTHGGFYRHFSSKGHLVAEACVASSESMGERLSIAISSGPESQGLVSLAAEYLSIDHRDDPSNGCPLAAMGSELARTDDDIRDGATSAVLALVELISEQIGGSESNDTRRRAIISMSTMVGALTMSRIVTDPELSAAILDHAKQHIAEGTVARRT